MIRTVWRALVDGVPNAPRRFAWMIFLTLVATATDISALVIIVRVAVALSQGSRVIEFGDLAPNFDIWHAIAIALICSILTAAGHVLASRAISGLVADFHESLQTASVDAFASASWPTQSDTERGRLQEMVSALSLRSSVMVQGLALASAGLLSVLAFFVAAIAIDTVATLALSVIGLGLVVALRPFTRRTKSYNRRFIDLNAEYASQVADFAEGALELRAFSVTQRAASELRDEASRVGAVQRSALYSFLTGTSIFKDSVILMMVVCLGLLALLASSSFLAVGTVAMVLLRAVAAAQQANSAYQQIGSNFRSLERIQCELNEFEQNRVAFGNRAISRFESLRVRGLGYTYPDGRVGLTDVSFDLAVGAALAVVGHSGAGKSTLVELLLRLRTPSVGEILVNGDSSDQFSEDEWASAVALVPQTPTMIQGTIADNVRFFRDFADSEVVRAIGEAGMGDEVASLPDGIHTRLGPRGVGLSGGQRQRLAIARALLGNPSLLILDEPTSALDETSELIVLRTLREIRRERALIIATHRQNTIDACSEMLVLDAGTVA